MKHVRPSESAYEWARNVPQWKRVRTVNELDRKQNPTEQEWARLEALKRIMGRG